jgi:cytochrome c553
MRVSAAFLLTAGLVYAALVPAAAQVGRAQRPKVTPPQGAVRQVIFAHCTTCHGIDDYAYNSLDRAGWNAYLTSKHRGMDVPLSAGDRDLLLDWLSDRFGPKTKPFPRAYVPPEITTYFTDEEADTLIKRACATCHGVERVSDGRHSAESWRVIAIDMRERGAKLSDTELERLVEWLGRVKGTNENQ